MQATKLIKIGNSQGVRIPKAMINHYGFGERLELTEVPEGILIRTIDQGKLSWQDTYQSMKTEAEIEKKEWDDWESFDMDIIDD